MAIVLPARQHTPEWHAARELGIGASQAAAAIGLSEWQSPISLWAEKLGLVPPQKETLSMRIGTALEPLISTLYTESTGVKIRRANNLRQHPEHAFMLASLDRRAGRKPVELKFSARATGYGEPGTDEVPDDVLVQVLHQLAVLDEPEGEVALLRPGAREVAIYPIRREAEAEAAMVEREAIFWGHVESRTEPPVDVSEATRKTLNALYHREVMGIVLVADEALMADIELLRKARHESNSWDKTARLREARIKAAMLAANASLVRAPGLGEIPWRQPKDSVVLDTKAYIAELEAELASMPNSRVVAEIRESHTATKENTPRFGPPKWEQEEETDV